MARHLFRSAVLLSFITLSVSCQSQNNGFIRGEGDIVKQEIILESIDGINLGFSGDVVITKGATQKVVVEGQKNIIDNIKRGVKKGMWNITFDKDVREAKPVTIHITLPCIKEAGVTGSGSIRSTNKFDCITDLALYVAGSGSIKLDYVANTTDLSLSGSGKIDISGSSNNLSVSITGSGDVLAENLKTDDCQVRITGSGDATVHADKSLDTRITGSGDVRYAGNASVESSITGSGDISKIR